MTVTAKLKQAFIKQAHEQSKLITLALFVKELEDDVEVAQHIAQTYGHDYDTHIQMHMHNMLDAQLKRNAGMDVILQLLLAHAEQQDTQAHTQAHSIDTQAQQATDALLSKLRLH